MGRKVIVGLKIMSLALFFSGCNHYKSIHFADAKIRKIFDSTPAHQKKFPTAPKCHLPTALPLRYPKCNYVKELLYVTGHWRHLALCPTSSFLRLRKRRHDEGMTKALRANKSENVAASRPFPNAKIVRNNDMANFFSQIIVFFCEEALFSGKRVSLSSQGEIGKQPSGAPLKGKFASKSF